MESILEHFRFCDAYLEGHFELSSGLHSPNYLQCALALQYPADAAGYGRLIAEKFVDQSIDAVASPAIGGLVIGYGVGLAGNVRFRWSERRKGERKLRAGFWVKRDGGMVVGEDGMTSR